MITTYHRPQTLDEALILITRPEPKTLPLGGGTLLSYLQSDTIELVDLQSLGLNQIKKNGDNLKIGATSTLQQLLESQLCPGSLQIPIKLEAPLNIRNAATVAGTLVSATGRSTFTTMLLALDSKIIIQPNDQEVFIGNFLPLRESLLNKKLITNIVIPLTVQLAFEYVSRTPSDKPLTCVALARWPSGRTRLALGGFGQTPILALDGMDSTGLEEAVRSTFTAAGDEWASTEYRQDVAATLAKRCLKKLTLIS